MDQNSGGLQQFNKTDPERNYQIFGNKDHLNNNMNTSVEPKTAYL